MDGVEGTYQKLDIAKAPGPEARIKLIGNIPASGKAPERNSAPSRLGRLIGESSPDRKTGTHDSRPGRNRSRVALRHYMSQYIIGIDLGTTNSALAYSAGGVERSRGNQSLSNSAARKPGRSCRTDSPAFFPLHSRASEFVEGALALPWNGRPPYIAGHFARNRGVENAGRLVSSAKSWLSNQNADPTQPLLPLTAPEGIQKISPLEASTQYLQHLRAAWDHAHPEAKLEDQAVLITVPASFDAAARELTQRAARASRLSGSNHARRAAGCVLCLDRAKSRLARTGQAGRSDSGHRYRRRHYRLHV